VPAEYAPGRFSKVVGLADLSGNRFAYALFDGGEIWVSDFRSRRPQTQRYPAGLQPYDGLVTPDGRYYLAGLFGEDGVALLDTWQPQQGTATHPAELRARRGEAAGFQDAASARLVVGAGQGLSAGDRAPRGAGRGRR
jgi:hypothetical protein